MMGGASTSFNMALLYQQEGALEKAIAAAQEAAHIFAQIGHAQYAQKAQQLAAQLQGGETPAPAQTDPIQAAFEAFQRAASSHDMQTAVSQHTIMTDAGFIQAIEQVIAEQVPPEHKSAFQQRLSWLKQIANA